MPAAHDLDGGFAAGDHCHRPLRAGGQRSRPLQDNRPHRPRVADNRLLADDDIVAQRARRLCRAVHRVEAAADDARDRSLEARIAGLRRLRDRSFQTGAQVVPRRLREERFDAEAIDIVPRVAIRRRIGNGGPRPDDAEIVADDVGDRETDSRPRCRRREPPAFDGRQVFADRVERSDIGAPLQQRIDGGPLVLERQGRRPAPPSSADAPPESSTTSVSPGSVRCATSIARRPAATLRSSGSGWLDGIHSSCAGSAIGKCVPMTMPSRIRSPAMVGERVGHERRGLADGNHAQAFDLQARCDRRILDGALDKMVRRRGFDGAAGDGQKVLAKVRQRRRLSERSSDRSSSTAPSRR